MRRVTRLFRHRSRKAMLITVLGTVLGLLLVGGGVYAAFGGVLRPQSSNDIELQRGLVGWWKLDGSGKDSSPYRNAGVVQGTTTTTDREGANASAISFNGTSTDYITVSNFDHGVMRSGSFNAAWTMSVWAKWGGTFTSEGVLLGRQGCNGGIYEYSNDFAFAIKGSGCWTGAQTILGGPLDSNWHLLTATYNAGAMSFYEDGVLQGTATLANMTNYGTTLGIGSAGGSSYTFDGLLDDARVYSRALSAAEAKALYDQYNPAVQAAGGAQGLIGQWKFDNNVKDSSPWRNNGTISGTSFVNDRKGAASSAITFNGTSDYVYAKIGNGTYFGANNKLSVSAWVYVTSSASGPVFGVSATPPGGGWNTPFLSVSGTTVYGRIWQVNGNTPLSSTVSANAWHHLALTYDPGGTPNEVFYVDGQSVGSGNGTYSPSNGTDYFTTYNTGTKPAGVASYLNTPIDDVRAYSRVLSAAEVQEQYSSYNSQVNLNANPSNTTSGGNINQGLAGYWTFNGNAKDSTPYRDNGTVNGATLTTDRSGNANSAYAFVGTSGQNISLPAGGPYRSIGTNSFSVAAWINTTETNGQRCVMSTAPSSLGFRFGYGSGAPYYLVGDGTHYQEGTIGTTTLNNGAWHHLVIVYSHSSTWSVTSYIDGASTGSVSLPSTITGTINGQGSYIGSMGGSTNGAVTGSIDQVRFYNRALSSTEVQALYSSGN